MRSIRAKDESKRKELNEMGLVRLSYICQEVVLTQTETMLK